MAEYIGSHDDQTPGNRISRIVTHRQYDVTQVLGCQTSSKSVDKRPINGLLMILRFFGIYTEKWQQIRIL